MKIKPKIGFAAVDFEGTILAWSVAGFANQVRKSVGEAWCIDPVKGWKDARKSGYRVIKIQIKPAMGAGGP